MALWIDVASTKVDATAKQLLGLLAELLQEPAKIRLALTEVDVDMSEIEQSEKPKIFLASAVPEVRRQRKMRALLEYLQTKQPARRGDFDYFLSVDEAELVLGLPAGRRDWRITADPLDATFVDVGLSQLVFDRLPLRDRLKRLRDEGYHTLNVTGDQESGKTVIVRLALHFCAVKGVERASVWDEDWTPDAPLTDLDLAMAIISELRDDLTSDQRGKIEDDLRKRVEYVVAPESRARLLVNEVREIIEPSDGEAQWILIDGLEKPQVHPSAVHLVERLILSLNRDLKPSNTKLVVTGFGGKAHRQSLDYRTTPIGSRDIETFIDTVTGGCEPLVTKATRRTWTRNAMDEYEKSGGDLGALGDYLRGRLEKHFAVES
ncbi:hypothetical protein ASF40_16905 [Microbacterium sp. Leaf288]|uniref:ATP-binding protein n=1 Tax=Microbacterium sp. Leaf288 TaxID=1736323 RepID=UPI0006F7D4D1|nr:ATP-binding protein [Microbacterium sp. Leaf288]KQP69538.1 hypothetical protein ASF40_16905 [Microbacterium sp. Leaf288]